MDPYEQSGGDSYGQGQGGGIPHEQDEDMYDDEEEKPQPEHWVVSYSSDTTYHQQKSYSQQPQEREAQYPPQYHQHQQYQEYQQHQEYQQYQQGYQEYQQQSYPERQQQEAQQYSQYQSAVPQPYQSQAQLQGGEAAYGADQAPYSVGNYQARIPPMVETNSGGSSYRMSSSVGTGSQSQYPSMMEQLVPSGAGTMPPTAEEHRRLVQAASGYSDTYTTESLTSDPVEYTDADWTEEDVDYATPIDFDNLPSRTLQDEKTRRKAEKMAKESLERYRKRMKGDEDYKKKKEELLRKINEELKRESDDLRKKKTALLKELKRHDHRDPNCKCNTIHQYLFFTKENKYITREQAYSLGWLTKEELDVLQCRSPEHSPDVSRSGSGKSSYRGGDGGSGSGSGSGGVGDGQEIKLEDDDQGGGEGRKKSGRHESRKGSGGGGKDDRYYKDRDSGGKHGKKSGRKGTK